MTILSTTFQGVQLEVSQPMGGGQVWHIYENRYFRGKIYRMMDGLHLDVKSTVLTGDDLSVIVGMVEGYSDK